MYFLEEEAPEDEYDFQSSQNPLALTQQNLPSSSIPSMQPMHHQNLAPTSISNNQVLVTQNIQSSIMPTNQTMYHNSSSTSMPTQQPAQRQVFVPCYRQNVISQPITQPTVFSNRLVPNNVDTQHHSYSNMSMGYSTPNYNIRPSTMQPYHYQAGYQTTSQTPINQTLNYGQYNIVTIRPQSHQNTFARYYPPVRVQEINLGQSSYATNMAQNSYYNISVPVPEANNEVTIEYAEEIQQIATSSATVNGDNDSNSLLKKQGSAKRKEDLGPKLKPNHNLQAIKRISTTEGWKQMNSWIKVAIKTDNNAKLKSLLKQCLQVDASSALLRTKGVDTPKIVKKLSKTKVKELSTELFSKWLTIIQREESGPKDDEASANKTKNDGQKSTKEGSNEKSESRPEKATSPKKTTETKEETKDDKPSETVVPKDAPVVVEKVVEKKKPRPKTAKVFIRNPRKTGLEDESATSSIPKPIKKIVSASAQPSKPDKPKQSTPSIKTEDPPKEITKPSSTPKTDSPEASPSKTPKADAKKPVAAKRTIMPNDSFMDSLLASSSAPKKSKQVKKKPEEPKEESLAKINIFEDVLDKIKIETRLTDANRETVLEIEEFTTRTRKIRFADEAGRDLVYIKFFDVERGERVNVTKMKAEDMKHIEMQQEGRYMKDVKSGLAAPWLTDLPLPKGIQIQPWKLIPLDNPINLIEPGNQSEAKKIEAERQRYVMEAYYDPNNPSSEIDESGMEHQYPEHHLIKLIPVDMTPDVDELDSDMGAVVGSNEPTYYSTKAEPSWKEFKAADANIIPSYASSSSTPAQDSKINVNINVPLDIQNLLTNLKSSDILTKLEKPVDTGISFSELSNILKKVQDPKPESINVNVSTVIRQEFQAQEIPPFHGNTPAYPSPYPAANISYNFNVDAQISQSSHTAYRDGRDARSRVPPDESSGNYRKLPCKFYAKGNCRFGDRCTFLHTIPRSRSPDRRIFSHDRRERAQERDRDERFIEPEHNSPRYSDSREPKEKYNENCDLLSEEEAPIHRKSSNTTEDPGSSDQPSTSASNDGTGDLDLRSIFSNL